jgi:hypothetical protein
VEGGILPPGNTADGSNRVRIFKAVPLGGTPSSTAGGTPEVFGVVNAYMSAVGLGD